jgi:hypothetical protein
MPGGRGQPGTKPSWYRRLPPVLRRVAEASDRVTSLSFRPGALLVETVTALAETLPAGNAVEVQVLAQRIADGVCIGFAVPKVWVRVAQRRPQDQRGELHGLYTPGVPPARDTITLWMYTAKLAKVVAPRTFLRTLLHELCHHLDYTHLRLRDSLHTQGFYQRESSLFHALDAGSVDAER